MKNFHLTPDQQQELLAALRVIRNRNQKSSVRINAFLLLGTGMTRQEVSDVLFLFDFGLIGRRVIVSLKITPLVIYLCKK